MRIAAALGLLAAALIGCRSDTDLSRFDQTWATPLSETTCAQWTDEMTANERYASGAELLLELRGESRGLPTDTAFTFFMSRITSGCAEATGDQAVTAIGEKAFAEYEAQLSAQ
jgi:hypothetical protein